MKVQQISTTVSPFAGISWQTKGFKYSGSNNLDEVGWYSKNSGNKTHPVVQKHPNELGLHDMSGNVWEWCFNWFSNYPDTEVENPVGSEMGTGPVDCGGSWLNGNFECRSDYHDKFADYRSNDLGFRLVFVP